MIKLQRMTPSVYYQQSRDFQFIGRLYDLLLNYSKTNSDTIYNLPLAVNSNKKLIDLLSLTLGFKSKHNYNIAQLTAMCSTFATILKNKGTKSAIKLACNTLLHAEGITEETVVEVSEDDPTNITIFVPNTLSDLNLLNDLFNYILPAGIKCSVIREAHSAQYAATNISFTNDWLYVLYSLASLSILIISGFHWNIPLCLTGTIVFPRLVFSSTTGIEYSFASSSSDITFDEYPNAATSPLQIAKVLFEKDRACCGLWVESNIANLSSASWHTCSKTLIWFP